MFPINMTCRNCTNYRKYNPTFPPLAVTDLNVQTKEERYFAHAAAHKSEPLVHLRWKKLFQTISFKYLSALYT